MMVHINKGQDVLAIVTDQFFDCRDLRKQLLVYLQLVFPGFLHIQPVVVFADKTGAVVATIDPVDVDHWHDLECEKFFEFTEVGVLLAQKLQNSMHNPA